MTAAVRGLTDREIAGCFNVSLGRRHRVRLLGGATEPFYLPGAPDRCGWALIRYTRDFAASALHELAHWCIAGQRRRRLPDYGYWYHPPPRDPAVRDAFAAVEVPVQALESVFADACGLEFRVSIDDLSGTPDFARSFERRVAAHRRCMASTLLPPRAGELLQILTNARTFTKAPGLTKAQTGG